MNFRNEALKHVTLFFLLHILGPHFPVFRLLRLLSVGITLFFLLAVRRAERSLFRLDCQAE